MAFNKNFELLERIHSDFVSNFVKLSLAMILVWHNKLLCMELMLLIYELDVSYDTSRVLRVY